MARFNRRHVLAGTGALLWAGSAFAQTGVDIRAFDIVPDSERDQTEALQAAIDAATGLGIALALPGGRYRVSGLTLAAGAHLVGQPGRTILTAAGDAPILSITDADDVTVEALVLDGMGVAPNADLPALLAVRSAGRLRLRALTVTGSRHNGIGLQDAGGWIEDCVVTKAERAGIISNDSRGLVISGNDVSDCGNGGILVWRSAPGEDGSIVSNNRISTIDWRDGGNGANGNGVNVFRADGVIIASNQIQDCAFSAIRINTGRNTQVIGNGCRRSGEVAIYSEFSYSGSVIAQNIVDGAAGGISITNLNEGGALAVCTGNIVRNIAERSLVNPDVSPFGIAAEAEASVSGNVVETVPGLGISAGYGPYLRNVAITDNVIRDTRGAIAVSVAEGAGAVSISGNLIAGAREGTIVGLAWERVVSADLVADAARFPHVHLGANTIVE